MKRPAQLGGHTVPASTGKCALCGEGIGEPRAGSIMLLQQSEHRWKHRLVCRNADQCAARRLRQQGETPPP